MKGNFRLFLAVMVISSLITGAPFKGWIPLIAFEILIFFPFLKEGSYKYAYALLKLIILVSHLITIYLPFMIGKKYFKLALYIAPPVFVAAFSIVSGLITIILIPFILLWIYNLVLMQKYERYLVSDLE